MQRPIFFSILLLIMAGCATPSTLSDDVTFIDTDAFDKNLSNQMSSRQDTIEVASTSTFKINEIPERLSKWLDKVVDYKGTLDVDPKPEKQAQSVEWIISVLPTVYTIVYDYVGDKKLYSPAQYYNATVVYDPKTNLVKKVVFTKKTQVDAD